MQQMSKNGFSRFTILLCHVGDKLMAMLICWRSTELLKSSLQLTGLVFRCNCSCLLFSIQCFDRFSHRDQIRTNQGDSRTEEPVLQCLGNMAL